MSFETVWRDLREAATGLDPASVLVTPATERPFVPAETAEDRIVVEFRERDERRILWRDQFEVLYDRLAVEGETLSLSELPPGVEPYVVVLSLGMGFDVEGDTLRASDDGVAGESPFRHPEWEVRTTPERTHDDAILLADALERYDAADLESLSPAHLVNLYVLLSDVQRESDRLRRATSDLLLDRIGPEGRLHGQFGTVSRATRERRTLKPTEEIFDALEAAGVPEEWVLGVDADKLDVVLSVTDLEVSAVYDVDEQVYVQKTGVEEAEKQSRLEGLKARLGELDDEEAAADLHAEIEGLEERIDEVLAAG
jgi:hypothetical protein